MSSPESGIHTFLRFDTKTNTFTHECSCGLNGSRFGPCTDFDYVTLYAPMQDHLESKHPGVIAKAHLITARDMQALDCYFKHLVSGIKKAKRWSIGIAVFTSVAFALQVGWEIAVGESILSLFW